MEKAVLVPADTVWIGITCGLSAAYVAGGLHGAMKQQCSGVSVIGFNPLEVANQRPLTGISGHLLGLLKNMLQRPGGILLNPIIGPEPITGSTRMKGGSATKIILDCLLSPQDPRIFLEHAQRVQALVFEHYRNLAQALEKAGRGLLTGKAVAYLAGHEEAAAAVMDASECPPTFGATENQLAAFVPDRFGKEFEGVNFAGHGFRDYKNWNRGERLAFRVTSQKPKTGNVDYNGLKSHGLLNLDHKVLDFISRAPAALQANLRFMALKWTLNAFSTGMFVSFGKVYGNQMIDLRISNLKLWDRAVRIVAELAQVTPEKAEHHLRDTVFPGHHEAAELPASGWVRRAAFTDRVVPLTILQAKKGLDLKTAQIHLQKFPRLREALA